MQRVRKIILNGVVVVSCVSVIAAVYFRQDLSDWWKLRSYVAPAEIVALSRNAGLSDRGEDLLFLHDPVLTSDSDFISNCLFDEATIVLGCYVSRQKIFVYDVDDPRIEGVEEVTAAHEMLHAAYDRLSDSEKQRVDTLTAEYYATVTNERLRSTIESYRARDPSVVPNELHSILGTEVRELPSDLETYYNQYFDDRQTVVTLAEAYEAEFSSREARIAEFDNELRTLNEQIDELQISLENQNASLQALRQDLDAASGDPTRYNALVPRYNTQVRSYNTSIATLRAKIDAYNAVVAERNAIAVEERELFDAIDSRPTVPLE